MSPCKAIASGGVEDVFYAHQMSICLLTFGLMTMTRGNDNR